MEYCEYEDCENYAEFFDVMDNKVCVDCMVRAINDEDDSPENYQRFAFIQ